MCVLVILCHFIIKCVCYNPNNTRYSILYAEQSKRNVGTVKTPKSTETIRGQSKANATSDANSEGKSELKSGTTRGRKVTRDRSGDSSSSSSSSCSSEERRKRRRKKRDRKRRRLKKKKRYEQSSSTSTSSSSSSEERRKRRKKTIAKILQKMEEKKLERKKVSGKFWLVDIVYHFAINLSLYILLQSICHFRTQTNTSYYILFLQGKRMRCLQ